MDNRFVVGPLSLTSLLRAFDDVARRHDALRTTFTSAGLDPIQRISEHADASVDVYDLAHLNKGQRRDRIDEIVFTQNRRCFDLTRGPLWHAAVARLARERHFLSICMSHAVSDGYSCRVFIEDLMCCYLSAERRAAPPPQPPSFDQIANSQRLRLSVTPVKLDHWRSALTHAMSAGSPAPGVTVTDQTDFLARHHLEFELGPEICGAMAAVAWRARTTPFMLLTAAYQVLLHQRLEQARTVVSTTTHGRHTAADRRSIHQFTADLYIESTLDDDTTLAQALSSTARAAEKAESNLIPYWDLAAVVNPNFDKQRPWPDGEFVDGNIHSVAFDHPELVFEQLLVIEKFLPGRRTTGRIIETATTATSPFLRQWLNEAGPALVISTSRRSGALAFNPEVDDVVDMASLLGQYLHIVSEFVLHPEHTLGYMRQRQPHDGTGAAQSLM